MLPDIATSAVERSETAERLFDQANNSDLVELVTVSAIELCVLGGPKHAVFEEVVTRAWLQMGDRRREKAKKLTTEGLVARRLLGERPSDSRGDSDRIGYSLSPALGIALAARCRPTFTVVTGTANPNLRTPRLFAVGDQEKPVRGIVVEEPAALPAGSGDFQHVKKLGPLGRLYRYVLVSPAKAAAVLAEWSIVPPPQQAGTDEPAVRTVSLYRGAAGQEAQGIGLLVRGDGTKAELLAPVPGSGYSPLAEHDLAGLRGVMADLINVQP